MASLPSQSGHHEENRWQPLTRMWGEKRTLPVEMETTMATVRIKMEASQQPENRTLWSHLGIPEDRKSHYRDTPTSVLTAALVTEAGKYRSKAMELRHDHDPRQLKTSVNINLSSFTLCFLREIGGWSAQDLVPGAAQCWGSHPWCHWLEGRVGQEDQAVWLRTISSSCCLRGCHAWDFPPSVSAWVLVTPQLHGHLQGRSSA